MDRSRVPYWLIGFALLVAALVTWSRWAVGPPAVLVVPLEAGSVQEAVDRVADDGLVKVQAGTRAENVVIRGKRVALLGSDAVIEAADPARPVLSFEAGASGSITGFELHGGLAGVHGDAAGDVELVRVRVGSAGAGVTGTFDRLVATRLRVEAPSGPGLQLSGAREVDLAAVAVVDAGGRGVEVVGPSPAGCSFRADGLSVEGAGAEGVAIEDFACPVSIGGARIARSAGAGIALRSTGPATVSWSTIEDTRTAGGLWGDGVLVAWSEVRVQDTIVRTSGRSSLFLLGCGAEAHAAAALEGDRLDCATLDVACARERPEGVCPDGTTWVSSVALADDGGNVCTGCDGVEHACRAECGLEPTPP